MDQILADEIKKVCAGKEAAVLATILAVRGSAPRKAGAKMLVTRDGQTFGSVGGGCAEAEVKTAALHALDDNKSTVLTVNMTQEAAADEGMACGGIMDVLVELLPAGSGREKKLLQEYVSALENKEAPVLVTVLDMSVTAVQCIAGKLFITAAGRTVSSFEDGQIHQLWTKGYESGRTPRMESYGDFRVFIEPAPAALDLVILGGGHIALPLSRMAKMVGCHVTVIDDRPSFANRQRFAAADKVICDDFLPALDKLTLTENSYVVIVTRGHRHDRRCLEAVLQQPAGYIGMIGSRKRVKTLMKELAGEGVPAKTLAGVHSPIGLDIGAETPEEIAVSIVAEIISVYRRK